jgi:hypothetical protein
MSQSPNVTGKLIQVGEQETFPSGFTKRTFVIETFEQYPQRLQFELIKNDVSMADHWLPGEVLTVSYNLRGNEHNGRYFVSLQAWRVAKNQPGAPQSQPQTPTQPPQPQHQTPPQNQYQQNQGQW